MKAKERDLMLKTFPWPRETMRTVLDRASAKRAFEGHSRAAGTPAPAQGRADENVQGSDRLDEFAAHGAATPGERLRLLALAARHCR